MNQTKNAAYKLGTVTPFTPASVRVVSDPRKRHWHLLLSERAGWSEPFGRITESLLRLVADDPSTSATKQVAARIAAGRVGVSLETIEKVWRLRVWIARWLDADRPARRKRPQWVAEDLGKFSRLEDIAGAEMDYCARHHIWWRRCRHCGEWFVLHDQRQRVCRWHPVKEKSKGQRDREKALRERHPDYDRQVRKREALRMQYYHRVRELSAWRKHGYRVSQLDERNRLARRVREAREAYEAALDRCNGIRARITGRAGKPRRRAGGKDTRVAKRAPLIRK